MPLDIPKELLDAGGWVFCAVALFGIVAALVKGLLVPGGVHQREIARGDKATAQLERNSEAVEKLTGQLGTLLSLMGDLLTVKGAR